MISRTRSLLASALLLTVTSSLFAQNPQNAAKKETNWPSFRGINASGIAEGFPTPTAWNVDEKKNVLWKTPIPGLGHSSPVIWGDRVYVTTAISGATNPELKVGLYGDIKPVIDDTPHKFKIYCLDRKTGKILWEQTPYEGVPKIMRHTKATHANSTIATDGKNVVAFFGSEGLYCYDMAGKLRWKKDFGVLDSGFFMAKDAQWGFASSPVIFGNKVLVQCDVQKGSFVAALDIADGKEIWRTPRRDVPTWSTPTVVQDGERAQLIVNGWKHIGGYDIETGKETWWMEGGGDIPVPTPVVANGLIYITNAHGRMSPIYAVKTTAKGDISLASDATTNEHIAWSQAREGAYMQTPLVYGDYLYVCRDNGILSCYEAKTGKRLYQERLGTGRTGFTASSVAADGKLYLTSEYGDIYVVKTGPMFELLSTNTMGEVCMATPAISSGVLFFRTQGHVVAIAGPVKK
jgi:outer membrane protein assembly factor BamB